MCQIDQILLQQSAPHFKNWKLYGESDRRKGHTNTEISPRKKRSERGLKIERNETEWNEKVKYDSCKRN